MSADLNDLKAQQKDLTDKLQEVDNDLAREAISKRLDEVKGLIRAIEGGV